MQVPDSDRLIDDKGTIFGSHSSGFEALLASEFGDTEIVTALPSIPDITSNDHTPEEDKKWRYDPFARELLVPRNKIEVHEKAENGWKNIEDLWYWSQVKHEGKHRALTDEEDQFYLPAKISSFLAPLRFIAGLNPGEDILETALMANQFISKSMVTQEGIAVCRQYTFLRNQDAPTELVEATDLAGEIDAFLASGDTPETYRETQKKGNIIKTSPEHCLGQWCYNQISDQWTIDVMDAAFRIGMSAELTTPSGITAPRSNIVVPSDTILMVITFLDEELPECDTEAQQRELIENRLQNDKNVFGEGLTHWMGLHRWSGFLKAEKPGGTKIRSVSSPTLINRGKIRQGTRKMYAQIADESQIDFPLPIVLSQYPGMDRGKTLWTILDNLYVLPDNNGERQLRCHTDVYKWAKGTRLFDIAVELWSLREQIFMPPFRAVNTVAF